MLYGPIISMRLKVFFIRGGDGRNSTRGFLDEGGLNPIGRSEPDLGCSDTVTLQLGIGCQVRGHSFFFFSIHV